MAIEDLPELDEDLFDFDELLRDLELLGEESSPAPGVDSSQELEPAPPAALPAGPPTSAASPTPTHRPHRRPPPVAPRAPAEAAQPLRQPLQQEQPAASPEAPPRRFVLSRGVALALAAFSVIHLAVLVLVMQAIGQVRGMVHEVGGQVASSSASVREKAEDIARTFDEASRPVVAPRTEGEAGLARALELMQRGESQRVRETLYSLLAVADRLPAETRHDVEARARFLIADTWRLEAEAFQLPPSDPIGPRSPAEEEPR